MIFLWLARSARLGVAGFAAGVTSEQSGGSLGANEGYSMDVTLPGASGTMTFWGVSQYANNVLTVEDSLGNPRSQRSHRPKLGQLTTEG